MKANKHRIMKNLSGYLYYRARRARSVLKLTLILQISSTLCLKAGNSYSKDQDINNTTEKTLISENTVTEPLTEKQEVIVSGKVTDINGEPLPGVNIVEKGTTNGSITDLEGKYSISISNPDVVLVFSFIGFLAEEIEVSNRTIIDVTLVEDLVALDEVVVVGYGTQKKATVSGSTSSIKGQEIAKSPAMNVTNSLAGRMPGIVAVGQSGEPGNDYSDIYIRGRSTLNDNSPLIVVDGIPNRSLERIDPSTIESITVLKDASGAIYGSQAANGVILVTTKRGKEGKYSITANFSSGWSAPTRIPEMTNSVEYATLVNEVNEYNGRPLTYTEEEIESYRSGEDPSNYPNTDWFDEVLKPWSYESLANLSMSGGNEGMKSFISLSSRSQDGFFVNSASKYQQHDLRINIDKKVNDNFDIAIDASIRLEDRSSPSVSSSTIFLNMMSALPTNVARWPSGEPGPPISTKNQVNPVVQVTPDGGLREGENYVFNVNSKLSYRLPWVEGLSLTATASLDRGLNYRKNFEKLFTLYNWNGTTLNDDGLPQLQASEYGKSNLTQRLEIDKQYLINAFFTYQKEIAMKHSVNIITGVEFIEDNYNWFSAQRRNFKQNYPDELNFGDPNEQLAEGSTPGANRWQNYFGRLNYSYKEKYNAEFVWRYQGSSKFHPDTRWGFFPGFSFAWRVSEENFWSGAKIEDLISDAKLRASWGKTGNDLIPPYQFYSLYDLYWQSFVTGDDVYHPVYRESLAGNPRAQWEEAKQLNFGADIYMFRGKLIITADYFDNLRTKILIEQEASIPQMTGTDDKLPKINLGEVRNNGADFQISWHDDVGDFNYSIGINGVYAQNKVLFFDEAEGALDWQKQTGFPMKADLYFEAIGIFRTPKILKTILTLMKPG